MKKARRWITIGLVQAFALGALIPQALPQESEQPRTHLVSDVTETSPPSGENLALDAVGGFSPGGGEAVIEPGSESAELISYAAVDFEAKELVGIQRPSPNAHVAGSVVEVVESEPTPEPSASGGTTPSPEPSGPPPADGASEEQATEDQNPSETPPAEGLSESSDTEESTGDSAAGEQEEPSESAAACIQEPVDLCDIVPPIPCESDPVGCITPWIDVVCNAIGGCAISCNPDPNGTNPCVNPGSVPCASNPLGCVPSVNVATTLLFDDIVGIPSLGSDPGCGVAGFTAYGAALQRAVGRPWTATSTTELTLSLPQTYSGYTDGSGRGYIHYCPPPGLGADPVEVTFTATVDAATGTALRIWDSSDNVPCSADPLGCLLGIDDSVDDTLGTLVPDEWSLVAGADSSLNNGCSFSASAPRIVETTTVRAVGTFSCNEVWDGIDAGGCIQVRKDGHWTDIAGGCQHGSPQFNSDSASVVIDSQCVPGWKKYRVYGHGAAVKEHPDNEYAYDKGPGPVERLYCRLTGTEEPEPGAEPETERSLASVH